LIKIGTSGKECSLGGKERLHSSEEDIERENKIGRSEVNASISTKIRSVRAKLEIIDPTEETIFQVR
jgi:hypothetical protein